MPAGRASATPRPSGGGYPFLLGVAGGDPTPSGAVLWTRLMPELFTPESVFASFVVEDGRPGAIRV